MTETTTALVRQNEWGFIFEEIDYLSHNLESIKNKYVSDLMSEIFKVDSYYSKESLRHLSMINSLLRRLMVK